MGDRTTSDAPNPESCESADYAELMTRGAVADLWAQLQAEADAGDIQAQTFLKMFGPFAKERLSGQTRS